MTQVWRWSVRVAAVAAAYYVTGRLGLLLAIPPGFATAVWPPSGIAIGAVLVWGYRVWPGVFLGSFALNVAVSLDLQALASSAALAAAIGAGASLQSLAGVYLIRRYLGYPTPLETAREAVVFLALGGPLASLINASVGATALLVAGAIDASRFGFSWWTWWAGDVLGVLTVTPLVMVAMAEPRTWWRPRWTTVAVPLATVFALSTLVFLWASDLERERIGRVFDQRSDDLTDKIATSVGVDLEVVESLASLFRASEQVTRSEFETFVERPLRVHEEIDALSWNAWVPHERRQAFETEARSQVSATFAITQLDDDGSLVRRERAEVYVPVLYLSPLEPNLPALGFDIHSDPVRAEAIDRAIRVAAPSVTAGIDLVQDPGDVAGFLLLVPVFDGGDLAGFTTGVFRVPTLVTSATGGVTAGLHLRIRDVSEGGAGADLYRSAVDAPLDPLYARRATFEVVDRRWEAVFTATQSFADANRTFQAWAILAAGLLFNGLLGVSLLAMTGRTARVEQLVEDRTVEVLTVNAELELARADLQERVDELARSNAELERFAYVASHDLQEPLRAIASHTQLLERRYRGQLGADADESIGYAVDGAKRMQALIDDLLVYSRLGRTSTPHGPVATRDVVGNVLTDLQEQIRESGAVVDVGDLPVVRGDSSGLHRLFLNLIENGIKFAAQESPRVTVSAQRNDHGWEFSVIDNGIGFEPEYAERIFGMFERLHAVDAYPGTGIGLAIVHRVVELHGGSVWAESEAGSGATFRFVLPAADVGQSVPSRA